MKKLFAIFVLWMTLLAGSVSANKAYDVDKISLLLSHSEHTLYVKKGLFIVKSYKVALGSGGGGGKIREGDSRTPVGRYRITEVRSSDRFHLFMRLNYPNISDAKRGLDNKLITRKDYRAVLDAHIFGQQPPQNLILGGAIGIHGIGIETKEKVKIHQNIDWTEGCIALRNDEVEELSQYVSVGTEINIVD
jgi:murein L,D-transpeptidase YafK